MFTLRNDMNKRFWMFLEIELSDMLPRLEKVFQVNNLHRDYENVWEWLESTDKAEELYFNISRSHNWEVGNYTDPICLLVEKTTGEPLEVEAIGRKLSIEFETTVYYGELKVESKGELHYLFSIEQVFE